MREEVHVDRRLGVQVATLARPEKLNALSPRLVEGLRAAVATAQDDDVRVLVLAGEGRSFCSGGDMSCLASDNEAAGRRYIESVTELLADLRRFPKPVVAAVQGFAVGAGAELACEADLIVMSTNAVLRFSDVSIGSTPASVQSLVRLVGRGTARKMVLLGEDLGAARALELGAVYEVVPEPALRDTALAVAGRLAELSSLSVRSAKRALQTAETTDGITELELNLEAEIACYLSPEMRRHVKAFGVPPPRRDRRASTTAACRARAGRGRPARGCSRPARPCRAASRGTCARRRTRPRSRSRRGCRGRRSPPAHDASDGEQLGHVRLGAARLALHRTATPPS